MSAITLDDRNCQLGEYGVLGLERAAPVPPKTVSERAQL